MIIMHCRWHALPESTEVRGSVRAVVPQRHGQQRAGVGFGPCRRPGRSQPGRPTCAKRVCTLALGSNRISGRVQMRLH